MTDPYRDDLEAATNRADALADDLDAEKRENERLRAELAERQKPPAKKQKQKTPKPRADVGVAPPETDLDQMATPRLFDAVTSPLGIAGTGGFWWYALLSSLMIGTPVYLALPAGGGPIAVVIVVAAIGLLGVAGLLHTARTAPRARLWITELPFTLNGLFGLFSDGRRPRRYEPFRITVRFANPARVPTLDTVEMLLGSELLATRILEPEKLEEGTLAVSCRVNVKTEREWSANRVLFRGLRDLLTSFLIPLHEGTPIARVDIRDGD